MSQVNALLSERLNKNKKQKSSKTAALAKRSASGNLSGFAGVFSMSELSPHEKELLENILHEYAYENEDVTEDLSTLISITSEVKAINNQAALLHGERIKRAQKILKEYRDGAFTTWLIATYGNRQTPYNFLQYYEFYESLSTPLKQQIESMPRQAIYTLASREGDLNAKHEIVQQYQGESKNELLKIIRDTFPLSDQDQRRRKQGEVAIQLLKRVLSLLSEKKARMTKRQRETIQDYLETIDELVE
ncbi:MAG: hypothetical protein K940chlam3_00073 [Chlamydiae bacterium]|nr:hypothetical protein [Chlamydiota bacterium]